MTTRPGTSVGLDDSVSATGIGTAASAAVISSLASIAEKLVSKELGNGCRFDASKRSTRLSVLHMSKLKLRESVTKTQVFPRQHPITIIITITITIIIIIIIHVKRHSGGWSLKKTEHRSKCLRFDVIVALSHSFLENGQLNFTLRSVVISSKICRKQFESCIYI